MTPEDIGKDKGDDNKMDIGLLLILVILLKLFYLIKVEPAAEACVPKQQQTTAAPRYLWKKVEKEEVKSVDECQQKIEQQGLLCYFVNLN